MWHCLSVSVCVTCLCPLFSPGICCNGLGPSTILQHMLMKTLNFHSTRAGPCSASVWLPQVEFNCDYGNVGGTVSNLCHSFWKVMQHDTSTAQLNLLFPSHFPPIFWRLVGLSSLLRFTQVCWPRLCSYGSGGSSLTGSASSQAQT